MTPCEAMKLVLAALAIVTALYVLFSTIAP